MGDEQVQEGWASEEEFLLYLEKKLQRLREATSSVNWVNTEDWNEVVRTVHNLRGAAGMFGHPIISRIFEGLEKKLAHPEDYAEAQLREDVQASLTRATESLRGPPPPPAVSVPAPSPIPAWEPRQTVLTPATQKRLKPLTILVLDDDTVFRTHLRGVYVPLGMRILESDRGSDLTPDFLQKNKVDTVVLDLKLPGEDGYSICKRLKANPASCDVPIVFVSATGELESRLFGWQVGGEDFIVKPVDPLELLLRIEFLVERANARRAQARQVGVSYDVFLKEMEKRIKESISHKDPLVLAMLTLTGAGSEEKQRAAGVRFLLDQMHRGDVLCSPTAGYLMVLQPHKSVAAARKTLETLVNRLTKDFALECKVGLAECPVHGGTAQDLLAAAKQCLDRARQGGVETAVISPGSHKDEEPHPPKVLMVDDDEEFLDFLGRHLADLGINAVMVPGSDRAVELVRQHKPDLVTLDVMMPDPDGLEVLKTLKADPTLAAIPVIMVSAKEEEEYLLRAFDLGAADYLVKPFRLPELHARVRKVLRETAAGG